ncbi:MAG TPA: hypothetical protein PKE69_26785 [Pyrinomonadaceae bacterium]|mgnify:CR=1 FL=1|nr:hypothetical protein [Pyrinomonadaceae bacterium]
MQDFIAEPNLESLGIPDIEIGELRIWTHSRKYPKSNNFWDVNWLNITVYVKTMNANVWVSGDIIHNTEIAEWLAEIENLDKDLLDEVNLITMERCVKLRIASQTYQRVSIEVDFFPNDRFQTHHFEFWFDKECLKDLINSCHSILIKFPITGNR